MLFNQGYQFENEKKDFNISFLSNISFTEMKLHILYMPGL